MGNSTFWTPEREQLLRDLWERGRSGEQIACAIGGGQSRSAILGKAFRMGLRRERPKPGPPAQRRPTPLPQPRPLQVVPERPGRPAHTPWNSGTPKPPRPPVDDQVAGELLACCAPAEPDDRGVTYCPTHRRIAYPAPLKPRQTATELARSLRRYA